MAESYTPPGMSVAYTVPELSDPADAPQAFRDFADSISGVSDTLSVLPLAVNTTLSAGEDGYLLTVDTSGGDIEVTVPANASVPLPVGYVVAVANLGGSTNVVKIKKGTGVNIQDQGFLQVEDYRITTLVKVSTDFWLVQAGSATYSPQPQVGLEGVGDWATVTAVTGNPTTGTYTDGNGIGWKYYRWTENGSVTTTAGIVDALVAGGGGGYVTGWGGQSGGRGGVSTGLIHTGAQTLTVQRGAGGSGVDTTSARGGVGSISGADVYLHAAGGWGGGESGGWGSGPGAGLTSSITGTVDTYGGAPNGGVGPVIIRVPIAFAQA